MMLKVIELLTLVFKKHGLFYYIAFIKGKVNPKKI